ncbi:Bromodomain-containing protein [Lineolata rhizophorae]|uniref:Bromodomain-containing protein n=1 Tax=Lineolata rhizophorae TaxID=578093 RepID=A0A6A6P749_9PEZI|nr:Bromodomain-containing protein [Lineolata rhizophorae]
MERDSKRKAGAAQVSTPDADARSTKRQRLSVRWVSVWLETPESTTEAGLKFLETLRQAKDKTGRHIATHFLTLPNRNELPEYYETILLPIAIDTIEAKLKRREYPNISTIESDVKRMVNNAKMFNDKKSLVFEDAERIRKTASNFMVKHNPAYRDPSYSAQATPIPPHLVEQQQMVDAQRSNERASRASVSSKTQPKKQEPPKRQESVQNGTPSRDPKEKSESKGSAFMQAQDNIIDELMHYKDESGLEIFTPFANLPPRTLTDYYQLIKHPVSLKAIQKRVRGIQGRSPPTWVTEFKSWDEFETEVSYIWNNAREYNEDGSDIFDLAGEFEEMFKERLAEAKSKVEEPAYPGGRVRLSAPKGSGIKLRLHRGSPSATASGADTPGARSSATPGVAADSNAAQSGANGARPRSRAGSGATPAPSAIGQRAARSGSGASPAPAATTNGVKSEVQPGQSPALSAIRPSSAVPGAQVRLTPSMPPPPARQNNGSPHSGAMYGHHPIQTHQQHQQAAPSMPTYYVPPQPANKMEQTYRAPGKTAADALIQSLSLAPHPGLNVPNRRVITFAASDRRAIQSYTITLPTTHHFLQITPKLTPSILSRPYKTFVRVNGDKLWETPTPTPITTMTPAPGAAAPSPAPAMGLGVTKDRTRPLFEGKLQPGVNRIEVECIAGAATQRAAAKVGVEQVEFERFTIFVHLLKQ